MIFYLVNPTMNLENVIVDNNLLKLLPEFPKIEKKIHFK